MSLILKTKGSQPISDKDRRWAEAKFAKLTKLLPPEAVVEVTLEDLYGPKRGIDKRVTIVAELPLAKEPFHLQETGLKFRETITTARDRFDRYLKKYHDRHQLAGRKPRKYWLTKLFERFVPRSGSETSEE